MVVSEPLVRVDELAQRLFDVFTQFCLSAPRGRRRLGDLKEVEFLTLSLLRQNNSMIVGDIQRVIGVLPAQMSRIIRSLETRDQPFIACCINPNDKRKIDVALTPAGANAFKKYQTTRISAIAKLLTKLSEDDLDDLQGLLGKLHELLSNYHG